MRVLTSIFLFSLLIGCVSTKPTIRTTTPKPTTSSVQPTKYTEDLSVVRPKVAPIDTSTQKMNSNERKQPTPYSEPKIAINQQLNVVLDSISYKHLENKYVEGFTIQVYSGSKREEAQNIKRQLSRSLPEIPAEVQYLQPNFRVKAGKYLQRLEAQKEFMAVKRHYPNAILIPDRIAVN